MVEVMKIMATSFQRPHGGTAAFSAPNSAAGHCWPMPPPEAPGHSWASLGQSLVGSLLHSPGSWCTQASDLTPPKYFLFIIGHYNAKVGNTWSNRQIWPWSTKWSRAKANRVLPREHTGHSKHPLPTTQERTPHMGITRWSIPKSDWLYSLHPKMEKLYTASKNKTRSWLWLISWTLYCQIQT